MEETMTDVSYAAPDLYQGLLPLAAFVLQIVRLYTASTAISNCMICD